MKITKIQIIKTTSPKVLARADVGFEDITVKGFKVLKDQVTGKDFVTPPSYYTPGGWRPLFKTTTKELWQELCAAIIKAYNQHLIEESLNEK